MEITFPIRKKASILALGGESAGNFCVFKKGKIILSQDFGDLTKEKNWKLFQKELLFCLKKRNVIPEIILSDVHPFFETTLFGKKIARKYRAHFIQIQHHQAHIFSAIGEKIVQNPSWKIPRVIYGIALDGTGYGTDGKIWGGEVFRIQSQKNKVEKIEKVGRLENQNLLGGELAISEPARMLIGILAKFLKKEEVFQRVKNHYSPNEFSLLYSQLKQDFNCLETSSAGRVLDAVSLLLGFCQNKRKYKHYSIRELEKNSSRPYENLRPKIDFISEKKIYALDTTFLFEYLAKNNKKDKGRLAATAQFYIAQGMAEIIQKDFKTKKGSCEIFFAGGVSEIKIISSFFASQKNCSQKKTGFIPLGDAGISFGQTIHFLLTNPRD